VADVLKNLPASRMLPEGRYGASTGAPGVVAHEVTRASATLIAGRGQTAAVVQAAKTAFGVELCDLPRRVQSGAMEFIGIGPGRWLVLDDGDGDALVAKLQSAFPRASVVDQSGGLMIFDVGGAKLGATLPKILSIDSDAAAFPVGDAATTTAAHINLTLWRTGAESWRFAVGRSYAPAFLRMLAVAAAEFGLDYGLGDSH
jgi:methylglutamate dehydrogenase subunit D